MNRNTVFEAERPRLVRMAERVLSDHFEANDVVQQAWLRLQRTDDVIENLPAWLTTVTMRLCLDSLRARTPIPTEEIEATDTVPDVGDEVALAATVGVALQVVLDRLSPQERIAFVLHDSFGFDFDTIAAVLDSNAVASRKLASRARAKVRQPVRDDALTDWEVVDAFMDAARNGNFDRLMQLLAPEAGVTADAAAIAAGTPERIDGSTAIATFFNGSAQSALACFVADRPGAAWFYRGAAKVVFDFTVAGGQVTQITFRADPSELAAVTRRSGENRVTPGHTPTAAHVEIVEAVARDDNSEGDDS